MAAPVSIVVFCLLLRCATRARYFLDRHSPTEHKSKCCALSYYVLYGLEQLTGRLVFTRSGSAARRVAGPLENTRASSAGGRDDGACTVWLSTETASQHRLHALLRPRLAVDASPDIAPATMVFYTTHKSTETLVFVDAVLYARESLISSSKRSHLSRQRVSAIAQMPAISRSVSRRDSTDVTTSSSANISRIRYGELPSYI